MTNIRAVICTVLGHVDHGKSSILDRIRGSAIVKEEAGQITQAIGASLVPTSIITKNYSELLNQLKISLTIPGLLFIDTPGHEAFTHLRKRGGNLADIAILVVDINEGFKPQTIEAIEILKSYKTPFVVAANKVDLINGWQITKGTIFSEINEQREEVQREFDTKLYAIAASLSENGFDADRFDRIESFTKQIAIVPCSAKQSRGISELVVMIAAVAQRYLESTLNFDPNGVAKGVVLEVKKEKGLGCTLDVILFDGTLKKNDTIVIGSLGKPIICKVKALFEPAPLQEMRAKKSQFMSVTSVMAANGVKISAQGLDDAIAGMPIYSARTKAEEQNAIIQIQKEVSEVLIATNEDGIVIKADALGSLEALLKLFKDRNIPIRRASIGEITRKDLMDAEASYDKNPLHGVVLGFNVGQSSDLIPGRIKIFSNNVIYSLIDEYETWFKDQTESKKVGELASVTMPCKIQIMSGYVFRQSNPAIVGCEVLGGTLKTGTILLKGTKRVAVVSAIQAEKESISEAKKGIQVAVSLNGAIVGRNIKEKDILYSHMGENDFKKLKELKDKLTPSDIEVLKEIAQIQREENPHWGL